MGAQNFNFAFQPFPQNGGRRPPNFAFFDNDYETEKNRGTIILPILPANNCQHHQQQQ